MAKQDFNYYCETATVILSEIFNFAPEDPERFTQEVQQQLVFTCIDKAIAAMQIITGLQALTCSECVHTAYERLNPNFPSFHTEKE